MVASTGLIALGSSPANATHYRATQITWQAASGNTVNFHVTASYRCTYPFISGNLDCDSTPTPAGTTFQSDRVNMGDGTSAGGTWEVISIDPANDVVMAESEFSHTYATTGPYTAALDSCCRLSGPDHINNPDGYVRSETIVDLNLTSANPVSSMPPIVDCGLNTICTFSVPAFDPDGQSLAWRLSTSAEASGSGGFNQPAGASIDASTGLYTWDTTGAAINVGTNSYYSTQVMVENRVGGVLATKTPVDFFIRLSDNPNQPPVFQSPTPADGTTINATVGDNVTFGVNATDPDTLDTVTLGMVGKPAAATFAPTAGNPASGTFSWVPTAPGTTILNLTAQDQDGLGATTRSVTIVVSPPPNGVPVIGSDPVSVQYSDALPSTQLATATDPDGDPLVMTSSALPATLSGTDDGTGGFDVSGTATAVPGAYPVTYTADDGTDTSTSVDNITITKEDCTLTAPLDIQSSAAGNTSLTATLGEPDSSVGDLSGKTISWSGIDAGGAAVGPFTASTNSAGLATAQVPLPEGVYALTASFSGNAYYLGCQATNATVVAVAPVNFKVTGGGWISQGTGKTAFGFNAKQDVSGLRGQLQIRTSNKTEFHGNVVLTLSGTANTATWTGTGKWNGVTGYKFEVSVVDNGTSGKKGDTISIVVRAPNNSVVFTTSGASPLKGGNIVVHK